MWEAHEEIPWGNPIGEFRWEFRVTSLGGAQLSILTLLVNVGYNCVIERAWEIFLAHAHTIDFRSSQYDRMTMSCKKLLQTVTMRFTSP